ncbi:MAG TPA: hypothetical protein PLL00_13790 [Bacteroidia bacterium]|nr:hypothetical protein [Bacteroidia bacterium]
MNCRLIFSGLFVFASTFLAAQNDKQLKQKSFHKQLKETSTAQIHQLKNGALLVRLKTNELAISALNKNGQSSKAEAVEKKQAQINKNIIAAFKKEFNFCPVYFFYSNYSTAIKNREFDKVIFLNDSLQSDATIKFVQPNFFIAEFGTVEQDTAKYVADRILEPNGNFSVKETKTYSGGPSFGYEGLLIRSDQFVQLRHPFPYMVRTHDAPLVKKKVVNKMVRTINKKLTKFYEHQG